MKIKLTLKLALVAILGMILNTSCTQQKVEEKITLDVSLIDTTFNPAEDFFLYANNGWMQKYPLPEDIRLQNQLEQIQLTA